VSFWQKLLEGIAVVASVLGTCGAFLRGFWGVSHDRRSWVDSHGYQLVQNDWWAKDRGCVARTPTGEEIVHSADLGSKAAGWVWQFAIFAVGTLPAVGMTVLSVKRCGGPGAAG
jgi:hypothetical protein